jgi:TM2 domain-containing membrane protein YozV
MKMKSPELAAVLSFFIPGLGQVYNGEFVKAFVFVLAAMAGASLCGVLVGYFIALPVWIWAVVDSYYSAEVINLTRRRRQTT